VLVEELADAKDAEWILEEGKADQRIMTLRRAMEAVLASYAARRMTAPLEQTSTAAYFRFVVRVIVKCCG
jgi:hypothetical protein